MAVFLSPVGGVAAQFFTSTGAVLTGGKLFTYLAGTTTPAATYTTSNGATAWTNPIVLDAAGRVPGSGEIWLTDGLLYKFVLKDANDVLIATYDNISGINSNFVAFVNQQEIVTATAGQTVFNLGISYQPATNSLSVFVDGVNQYGPGAQYSYVETDSTTVTFNTGLHVGAEVKFTTTQQQGAGAVDAAQVSYSPPFAGGVATNVEAKLRQYVSVKDFGAIGDGLTNDTVAIQTAVNSGAGMVFFPAGTYLLGTDSSITIAAQIKLIGEGRSTIIQKNTGTADIFVINANNVSIQGFALNGPNNVDCDGIIVNAYSGANISDVYGYQLASTITAGYAGVATNLLLSNVISTSNTQQGIHLFQVQNATVVDCQSFNVGTTNLHHGMYVSKADGLFVSNFYASGCAGFALQLYAANSHVINNVSVNGLIGLNCGTGTGATKGGMTISTDSSGSTISNIRASDLRFYNCAVYGLQVNGAFANVLLSNVEVDGASLTGSGVFVGSAVSGNRSVQLRDFVVEGCTTGVDIDLSAGTIQLLDIDDGLFRGNTTAAKTAGVAVANVILGNNISYVGNTTNKNGTFTNRSISFKGTTETTIAANTTFTENDGNVFIYKSTTASYYLTPSGTFNTGYTVFVRNTGSLGYNIIFRCIPAGGADVNVGDGTGAVFSFDGTRWQQIV